MKILSLDISTKTGYAVLEDGKLLKHGLLILNPRPETFGKYPYNYVQFSRYFANLAYQLARDTLVDAVVIEETAPGRETYSQKILEFLHYATIEKFYDTRPTAFPVHYIRTGEWRKVVGLRMSNEDKKGNRNLKKNKAIAKSLRAEIKLLGTKKSNKAAVKVLKEQVAGLQLGRITRKHLSVRMSNERFDLNLKIKDNDIADAIALGASFFLGARLADGLRPKKK